MGNREVGVDQWLVGRVRPGGSKERLVVDSDGEAGLLPARGGSSWQEQRRQPTHLAQKSGYRPR